MHNLSKKKDWFAQGYNKRHNRNREFFDIPYLPRDAACSKQFPSPVVAIGISR